MFIRKPTRITTSRWDKFPPVLGERRGFWGLKCLAFSFPFRGRELWAARGTCIRFSEGEFLSSSDSMSLSNAFWDRKSPPGRQFAAAGGLCVHVDFGLLCHDKQNSKCPY